MSGLVEIAKDGGILDGIRVFTGDDRLDAENIVQMICRPHSDLAKDFYGKSAQVFLVAVALHLSYQSVRRTGLSDMLALLLDPRWDCDRQIFEYMRLYEHDPELKMGWKDCDGKPTKTHPAVFFAAQAVVRNDDIVMSRILGTAILFLQLYP